MYPPWIGGTTVFLLLSYQTVLPLDNNNLKLIVWNNLGIFTENRMETLNIYLNMFKLFQRIILS